MTRVCYVFTVLYHIFYKEFCILHYSHAKMCFNYCGFTQSCVFLEPTKQYYQGSPCTAIARIRRSPSSEHNKNDDNICQKGNTATGSSPMKTKLHYRIIHLF